MESNHDAEAFCFVEMFSRSDLDRHPVWCHYEDSRDRDLILGWGVGVERLEGEIAKFQFCGPHPLFPVLDLESLPDVPNLVVRVAYTSPQGARFDGYVIGAEVFGLYVEGREFCFNRTLPAAANRQAEALLAALSVSATDVFPLRYSSAFTAASGARLEGELPRFW